MLPILIGNAPSSGSSLLAKILNSHSDIFCGPELETFAHPFFWKADPVVFKQIFARFVGLAALPLKYDPSSMLAGFVPSARLIQPSSERMSWFGCSLNEITSIAKSTGMQQSEFMDLLYKRSSEKYRKSIWIEKTPSNIYSIPSYLRFSPNAKAIIILRDGRDVISSLLQRGYTLSEAVSRWGLEASLSLSLISEPRVHVVKYEDLVYSLEATLRDICIFLDVEFQPKILNYFRDNKDVHLRELRSWKNKINEPVSNQSIGRYQSELNTELLGIIYHSKMIRDFKHHGFNCNHSATGYDILKKTGYLVPECKYINKPCESSKLRFKELRNRTFQKFYFGFELVYF